jgi:FPC/CPF motif-containing protein YcgG
VERVHAAFRAFVLDPEYPCVGSRSALNQGSYRFALYDELAAREATEVLAFDLHTFVREQPAIEGEFTTFVACFESPKVRDEEEFERLLWDQLRQLHDLDRHHHRWDPSVSSDPDDPQFSFSFAGRAFFVVGLSPAASRWARQFPWPLLAFNAHFQFEELRRTGHFERVREVVRERDEAIEGVVNPMLADFGDHTEARQYAGREVNDEWSCPVKFE